MVTASALAVTVSLAAQQSPKPTTSALKPAASHPPAVKTMLPEEQTALVKQYCATCHSERGKAGNLSLAAFDAAKIEQDKKDGQGLGVRQTPTFFVNGRQLLRFGEGELRQLIDHELKK